jgi:hypothetical protein
MAALISASTVSYEITRIVAGRPVNVKASDCFLAVLSQPFFPLGWFNLHEECVCAILSYSFGMRKDEGERRSDGELLFRDEWGKR